MLRLALMKSEGEGTSELLAALYSKAGPAILNTSGQPGRDPQGCNIGLWGVWFKLVEWDVALSVRWAMSTEPTCKS